MIKRQRGGTFLGFIIGVVFGLGIALGVAVYVTKVPVPFFNKSQSRSAEQDVEEAKKNKDWDPNAPLSAKSAARASQPAASTSADAASSATPASAPTSAVAPPVPAGASVDHKAAEAKTTDPLGDLARARAGASTPIAAEPFIYWVQVGAYRTMEEAEAQRAKLSFSGIESKTTEREQSGRTVFRVRVGPFDSREDGEKTKVKLDKIGLETALVKAPR